VHANQCCHLESDYASSSFVIADCAPYKRLYYYWLAWWTYQRWCPSSVARRVLWDGTESRTGSSTASAVSDLQQQTDNNQSFNEKKHLMWSTECTHFRNVGGMLVFLYIRDCKDCEDWHKYTFLAVTTTAGAERSFSKYDQLLTPQKSYAHVSFCVGIWMLRDLLSNLNVDFC